MSVVAVRWARSVIVFWGVVEIEVGVDVGRMPRQALGLGDNREQQHDQQERPTTCALEQHLGTRHGKKKDRSLLKASLTHCFIALGG